MIRLLISLSVLFMLSLSGVIARVAFVNAKNDASMKLALIFGVIGCIVAPLYVLVMPIQAVNNTVMLIKRTAIAYLTLVLGMLFWFPFYSVSLQGLKGYQLIVPTIGLISISIWVWMMINREGNITMKPKN